eukprot:TRINITY_DN128_c0_g4_i1.p1 TRINITY_DN128_c0_g4~~TRINITY_DN128_c0_g4_i1.p1  ORF type:complete len:831 (+),score=263.15 TRINITY_DN128_c0_g4_i1:45-2537(+)
MRSFLVLALLPTALCAWDAQRSEETRTQQHGADIGRRALRAVSRGGAGRPSGGVYGSAILAKFREGVESGLWHAPHEVLEEIADDSLKVDPLFSSQVGIDIAVSLLAMLATMSAAASGIGGGGLLVPIYLLVMGWDISLAVPLSNATIFGNAIANIMINFPLRHPTADRPLVDFDLALVLIPMELCGSLVGVMLNIIFPQWLTLTCLLILLCITTYRTYMKGSAQWAKENVERKKIARRQEADAAAAGDLKTVTLEDQEGQQVEMQVINGDNQKSTISQVAMAMSLKGSPVLQFADKRGDKLKSLAYDTVDNNGVYYVTVRDPPTRKELLDTTFRKTFEKNAPTAEDLSKLIILDPVQTPSHSSSRKYAGSSQPYDSWSTVQVISWLQAVTDDNQALCYNVEHNMLTGTDLAVMTADVGLAHQEFINLGVSVESDRELLILHVRALADQDFMLLVYTAEEVPWASWNRSTEYKTEGMSEELDLDGWMEDDPNHPKNLEGTYLSSQSYVNVHKWSVETVLLWVDKISDYNYQLKQQIMKNDIDGRTLLELRADDLVALGVPQLGPRLSFIERVRELSSLDKVHKKIVESERHIPYTTNLLVLFASWVMLLVLAILKGGGKKGGQSPVATWEGKTQEEFCNTPSFWVLWWIGVPVLVVVTYLAGNYLVNKHEKKLLTHFEFHEGDIRWTRKRVRIYPAFVIGAGVLAGLLGVGGAMVTGPLMLEMNMIPRVSTATSSFLIIFTTGVAAIAYISLGTLKIDYGIWFACIGATGATLGLRIINLLLKKYNRQSMVIWSLTLVFLLAIVGTIVAGIIRTMDAIDKGTTGFNGICG